MENKFQSLFGGRVGGVRPPYRDHNISKIIFVMYGLDTSHHASTSLSLRSARRDYSTNEVYYETH